MEAARQLVEEGMYCPPITLIHADTLVEQPEITFYARAEFQKMRQFAQTHGIPLEIVITEPKLNDSWPVRVIGGRALGPFAKLNHFWRNP